MTDGYLPIPKGFSTAAAHSFEEPGDLKSTVPPMVSSATYRLSFEEPNKFSYSRIGNPNRKILEDLLAKLENGKYGIAYASGLGAETALVHTLRTGDHILLGDDVYGGTNKMFTKLINKFGIECDIFDCTNLAEVEKLAKPTTKIIWVESLTNPLLTVVDIKGLAEISKKLKALLVVDNTFFTPYYQRSLDLGADVVLHSISKYLNGHADVVMGALVTNNEELFKQLQVNQQALGIVPAPFDCSQVVRSLKTLSVRMEKHSKNALAVAKFLEQHPKVEKVLHPGLPSHRQHELCKKLSSGTSGMVSFYIKGGLDDSKKLLSSTKLVMYTGSLGDILSCFSLPVIMSHFSVNKDIKDRIGITDNLIRMSVGLEDVEDIISDLDQALAKI